jgi:hypothetical protein
VAREDDFEIGDALAERRERYGVGWFDSVRIRSTPQTERLGFAGLAGQVFGETMPSEGAIKGERVVGELEADYALYVDFGEGCERTWFAPEHVTAQTWVGGLGHLEHTTTRDGRAVKRSRLAPVGSLRRRDGRTDE